MVTVNTVNWRNITEVRINEHTSVIDLIGPWNFSLFTKKK